MAGGDTFSTGGPDQAIEPNNAPESTSDAPAEGTEFLGKLVGIIDGNTIAVLMKGKESIRIRLNGIDTPELGQQFGRTAKEFLANSIGGKVVRVVSHGQDRYGRTIGDVFSTETFIDPIEPGQLLTGQDDPEVNRDLSGLNMTMVMNGLAWHYVKYAPDRQDLAGAEKWAPSERLRLWSDDRRVAPSVTLAGPLIWPNGHLLPEFGLAVPHISILVNLDEIRPRPGKGGASLSFLF